ncbi:dnaK-type molecular chaperone bipA [Coprinopsis cinerea okayama7|uniref:DnaK-type molecular chaperone bipA n=1 Tax=Coprinopsis cinerea (strain Okayama-7 / 130 / ATCC MYA-4618 / FGSC 9003) TaxID=240176 RepID=A8NLE7_COPC7|nr:dnaK-type molecular chaperone bipA [Coprinopsis cinerea okayama7\|eukprot:XP_001834667.1 dnaK-type molecular chaperone bipA [Coprinopsis cinerea okayama7\
MAAPNGSANAQEPAVEFNTLPPVLGINFGNTYASIADGLAEAIANEDGERQIACAISFHGEEIHYGTGAMHQLVKNSKNTILGFRNLIGKKFSEISQSSSPISAPVIQHPDIPDEPAYKVEILAPAPSPIPPSTQPSNVNTPLASKIGTPRSEPVPAERILTVSEVTTMFLANLLESAEDFLGKKVQTAVMTVPSWFTDVQREALEKAALAAGIPVKQLLDEPAAAAATSTTKEWSEDLPADRTQLVVDVGASGTSLSLLSIRQGLSYVLASSNTPGAGADQIDDRLIKFFAADFTKKTKTPLTVAPSTEVQDRRAEARLRLAIEHTKRTISASPGAATCSVESLKDGLDYTGSINRMRFDMVASPVYGAIADAVISLLSDAGVDAHEVDEIVYVGGTASLPGLDEHIILSGGFNEDVQTPFARGTVTGGGVGDPTTVLARGCAIQAALINDLPQNEESAEVVEAFHKPTKANQVKATSRTLGLLFPSNAPEHSDLGGVFVPVVQKETALPVRRTVQFAVGDSSRRVAFEVWEIKEGIRVEKIKGEPLEDDDEDEEPEETEVKHKITSKEVLLGALELEASKAVEVQFVVGIDGQLDVEARNVGGENAERLHVPAP